MPADVCELVPAQRRPVKVLIFGPKGGVGKTTITAHLAVCAAQDGMNVVCVDFDGEQGSLTEFHTQRERRADANVLAQFGCGSSSLDQYEGVLDALNEYDIAFIDMPPGFEGRETIVNDLAGRVDYILMPTGMSKLDRRKVIPWMTNFQRRNLRAAFIHNMTDRRVKLRTESVLELEHYGRLLSIEIPRRVDIAETTGNGTVVVDTLDLGAANEFRALWAHLKREIGIKAGDTQ